MELLILFLVVGSVLGLIPAAIAQGKGESFGAWWIYGALLFIVALPHGLLMESSTAAADQRAIDEGGRKCPFCAEMIRAEAIVCKHCGRDV